jgi:small subunit ribosomal protein S1
MSSDRPDESFAALFEKAGGATPPRKRNPRIGETLDALVVQVGKDAVFVELDGRRQGFIESIDLKGPDGVIKATVGDRLRARVVSVDPEAGVRLAPTVEAAVAVGASVALSPAGPSGGAGPDAPPAVTVAIGQVISGVVDRIESYGLFVQLDGTRGRTGRGLLPVSELGVPRGTDLRKTFPIGTKLKAKILEIGEGKLRLSVRALKDDEERSHFEGFREQEKKGPVAQGFGTLGDLSKFRKSK